MPSAETEAYIEGARNLWRYHWREGWDLIQVLSLVAGLVLIAWAIDWGIHELLPSQPVLPCGLLGCHTHSGLTNLGPAPKGPGIPPVFEPVPLSS